MDSKKGSVLIVDDEAINIKALVHILGKSYSIFVEKTGQGCIEAAKRLQPDLILLDVLMPAMSGFEVIEQLKEDNNTQSIPVIFVTGLTSQEDKDTGFKLGAVDYISKPFSSTDVEMRVKSHIYAMP